MANRPLRAWRNLGDLLPIPSMPTPRISLTRRRSVAS